MSSIIKYNIYKKGHIGYISHDELSQDIPGIKTASFYAINPIYTPIPSYTKLICVNESNQGKDDFGIKTIETVYDPFENRAECTYFITWTNPTPYTTPLFLYESSGSILPSFEKLNKKGKKESFLSPIYVLTEKPMKNTIFPAGGKEKKWFRKKGEFRFKSYMGRCIPDLEGVKLEQCTLEHDFNLTKPQSLTDYLNEKKEKKEGENKGDIGEKINSIGNVWVSIIIGVFLGLLLFVVFKKK